MKWNQGLETRMRWIVVVAVLVTVWGYSQVYGAGFVLVSQSRSVQAAAASEEVVDPDGTIVTDSDNDADAATDFGPFNGSATVTAGMFFDVANGTAQLDSILSSGLIRGIGSASVDAQGTLGETGSASANSSFEVNFTLDTAVEFDLAVKISADPGGPGPADDVAASFSFQGPSGIIESLTLNNPDLFNGPFEDNTTLSGVLDPGSYAILGSAQGSVSPGFAGGITSAFADYDIRLTVVPEPASMSMLVAVGMLLARPWRRYPC